MVLLRTSVIRNGTRGLFDVWMLPSSLEFESLSFLVLTLTSFFSLMASSCLEKMGCQPSACKSAVAVAASVVILGILLCAFSSFTMFWDIYCLEPVFLSSLRCCCRMRPFSIRLFCFAEKETRLPPVLVRLTTTKEETQLELNDNPRNSRISSRFLIVAGLKRCLSRNNIPSGRRRKRRSCVWHAFFGIVLWLDYIGLLDCI
mmetsp:Transcript_22982/g.50093  ORF Transcript_22982/g.50093 Transcript_22982/m.50093 type:complete len:202 (-) Transcript_22982:137-742(-)